MREPAAPRRAPLRMYWWRPEPPLNYRANFGDELGPYLVEALFGLRTVWADPSTCELAGAGSIIEILLSGKSRNRPLLWGSGMFYESSGTIAAGEFDITALRGSLTKARIKDLNGGVALGDPGLLAHVLVETCPRKKHLIGIVPHFLDADLPAVRRLSTWDGVTIIDVTKPAPAVVREIAQCHYILSSSLHGLVVADSLGTPNAYLPLSNDTRIGGPNKFQDYYSVFAEPDRQVTFPVYTVLSQNTQRIAAELAHRYRPPADLPAITDALIAAFPC